MADEKSTPAGTLDGQAVTTEQLKEARQELPQNKKIVEIDQNTHRTLTRMQD